jgi:hypothetical protein
MRSFPWVDALAVALALAASAGCSAGGTKPRTCEDDAGCASGSRCVQRSCAANAAPVARIALPEAPVAYDLLTFDGTASSDGDAPLDAVASYSWSFKVIDAPCPAPVSASTSPQAIVRFGCAGRFAVDLEVADEMGVTSTSSRELAVGPRAAPLVEVGQDLVAEHACSGEPLVCHPEGAVTLAAAAPSAIGEVVYDWTAEAPPNRPLGTDRRVSFQPGPDVPNPTVVIETDGTAISGDWIFRVAARDAAGPLGDAAVRVSVNNRAPAITSQLPPFPHTFDPKLQIFEASGAIRVEVVDPDGDPMVAREATWRHVGDGAASFVGVDTGETLTVQVTVAYTTPDDALSLIGREGLERLVELRVQDANGADAFKSWPIVIENRSPGAFTGVLEPAPVSHAYEAASSSYVVEASFPYSWSDPDGDPLFQVGETGDAECGTVTFVGTGTTQHPVVSCVAPFVTFSTLQNFAREHRVTITPTDPWGSAAKSLSLPLTITNAAPAYHEPWLTIPTSCTRSTTTCCETDPETRRCILWGTTRGAASAIVPGLFTDSAGDPLAITVDGKSSTCTTSGQGCDVTVTVPAELTCPGETWSMVSVTASDGAAHAVASMRVDRTCQ